MDPLQEIAEGLLAQGEMLLLKKNPAGVDLFERASKLEVTDFAKGFDWFLRQAYSLYEYGYEEGKKDALLLACKKLKAAARFNPDSFSVWHLWGNILSHLGKKEGCFHYFLEAKEKYEKAIVHSEKQPGDLLSDLYWEYGSVWNTIAEHSQEALDMQIAVDAFAKACSISDQLPAEFWTGYGHSCLRLGGCINDIRLYVKAINCFKHAIAIAASYEGWGALAHALENLYAYTHDEDHFSQANECYLAAAQLCPQDATIWFQWAKLLCESGKRHQDVKRLRACIEKCHRTHACDAHHFLCTALWAEALAFIGEYSDRIDLLYDAQNKISEISQSHPDDPDIWLSYGTCLNCFARYFDEIDYYYQAIEQFQTGLSIDRTRHRLWHAIASTYAAIGYADEDPEAFERACHFFTKAIDLHASSEYFYDFARVLSKIGEIQHQQQWLETALIQFEHALKLQKNAVYLHPHWLFHYACTLDLLGDYHEEASYYTRAIEVLSHVLMIDPDFPGVHHRLSLVYAHLGDLLEEADHFYRAIHHYRLAFKRDEENDQILLDWSVTLINLAECTQSLGEMDQFYREAEHKLTASAKMGNLNAFYYLACVHSLQGAHEKSLQFLERSVAFNSLPPLEEILQDHWLDGVRATSDFHTFLLHLEKRPNLQEER
jgi:tetratricopeptide (TPR) repeat protein